MNLKKVKSFNMDKLNPTYRFVGASRTISGYLYFFINEGISVLEIWNEEELIFSWENFRFNTNSIILGFDYLDKLFFTVIPRYNPNFGTDTTGLYSFDYKEHRLNQLFKTTGVHTQPIFINGFILYTTFINSIYFTRDTTLNIFELKESITLELSKISPYQSYLIIISVYHICITVIIFSKLKNKNKNYSLELYPKKIYK
jgi:hypothetical protein